MKTDLIPQKFVGFTLSPVRHNGIKPVGKAVGKIINSFSKNGVRKQPIQEFSNKAVHHPWLPYVTSDKVGNDSFLKSNILSLDIDNKFDEGYTISKFLGDCKKHGLECSFIYTTFRDTTDSKNWRNALRYRAVFYLSEYIKDFKQYKIALQSLQKIFQFTDESFDAHMYCNGGKFLCYNNWNAQIDIKQIALISSFLLTKNVKTSSSKTRKIDKHFKALGLEESNQPIPLTKKLTTADKNLLIAECSLIDQFLNKKEKIYHPQLFGLFLFLKKYVGGLKLFKSCIRNNPKIDDYKIIEIIGVGNAYLKYTNEQTTKEFLDVNDPARKYYTLSSILQKSKNKAVVRKQINLFSLQEAEEVLKNSFKNLEKQKISILQFPVGIGKTEKIVQQQSLEKTIIAVPNKKLLEEIYSRLESAGHSPLKLIACEKDVLPDYNFNYYKKLHQLGLGGKATGYLRSLAMNPDRIKSETKSSKKDIANYLKDYFNNHDEILNTTKPIITTHAKLLTTKFDNHERIIVDEDITLSMLKSDNILFKDIGKLSRILSKNDGLKKYFIDIIIKASEADQNECFKIPTDLHLSRAQISTIDKIIIDNKSCFNSPIGKLSKASAFSVQFKNEMPYQIRCIQKMHYQHKDKSTLILSATLNEFISSQIFPRASHTSMVNVKHRSNKLFQISDKSFSRIQIATASYQNFIKAISEKADDNSIITFFSKEIKKLFPQSKLSRLSLENCEGSDILKGKKIMVVGSPNIPSYQYLLYAHALGIKFTEEDSKWEYCKINDERGTFSLMTFKNPELRKLHFYYLESKIIQAIGRCRSLREETAEVNYFGNFPIQMLKQLTFREFQGFAF